MILTIPVSTVHCERGFSVHKITKNKLRNRLTSENVDFVMRIIFEGEPLKDFDFSLPLKLWREDSGRKIFSI